MVLDVLIWIKNMVDSTLTFRRSRPSSVSRRVFLREPAPQIGFSGSTAIYNIVESALARAGIDAPCKGPHLFRHYVSFLTMS